MPLLPFGRRPNRGNDSGKKKTEEWKIKKPQGKVEFEYIDETCKVCGGTGIYEYLYNNRNYRETCPVCSGSGIIQRMVKKQNG